MATTLSNLLFYEGCEGCSQPKIALEPLNLQIFNFFLNISNFLKALLKFCLLTLLDTGHFNEHYFII